MNRILYLATTNRNKIKEISSFIEAFLKGAFLFKQEPALVIKSLRDVSGYPSPEENGSSFQENANIKSLALLEHLKEQGQIEDLFGILSEDSGLEVCALQGAPGLFSARYSGPQATDKKNNRLLLQKMENQKNRKARYACALSFLFLKSEKEIVKNWTAYCEGNIDFQERGQGGFGYDPLFIPLGEKKTFGELPFEFKQKISHRTQALQKWTSYLLDSGRV